ncbi:MAG: hypothetical protein KDD61_08865 [Bdellovibrionales bacterium]|nr:hypothetical protein [Bdellovibrionales bacterium]
MNMKVLRRFSLRNILFFSLVMGTSITAHAFTVDLNFFYFSDALTHSSDNSRSDLYYDLAVMTNLTRTGSFMVGWNYGAYSVSEAATSSTTYSGTEMGPRFGWYIDRKMEWCVFATYNLQAEATYSTTSNETWRGSSYKMEFGYSPEVFDGVFVGGKLIYYAATFTEKLVGSATYSTVSYSRSLIYPTLMISFRW